MKLNELLIENTETPKLSLQKFNPDLDASIIGKSQKGKYINKNDKFLAKAGGQVFRFDNKSQAKKFVEEYNNKKVKKRTKFVNKYSSQRLNLAQKFGSAWRGLEDVPAKKRSTVRKFVSGFANIRGVKLMARVFEAMGFSYLLLETHAYNVAYFQDQAEIGPAAGGMSQQEAADHIIAAQASVSAQITVLLIASLSSNVRKVRQFITGVRLGVRALQGVVGATGVGFFPALLSAIVSEAGFLLAQYYLTRPSVQRALTEWLVEYMSNSVLRTVLEGMANITGVGLKAANAALDSVTGGAVGIDEFLNRGGFTTGKGRTTPSGTAYASSEWAKLTFQNSLFPPGTSSQLVEYIPPAERQRLILNAMELSESPQDRVRSTGAAQPGARGDGTRGNANVSSQPG
jgi:hypothetical protein